MSVVKKKRTLLHDEPSIVLQPEMVRRLGNLTDAAVLQQLNYWMPHAKVEHQGRRWVFKTYENWSKEIGISAHQVRRAMDRLEALGLVMSCTPRGRTKHYSINYEHALLDGAESPDSYVADLPDDVAGLPDDVAELPTYKDLHETREEKHLLATPKKDDLFETVAKACGINLTGMTRSARGQLNKACKELREVGATSEQVKHKAKAYRAQYPNATLTPTALIKHWSSFAELEKKQQRPSVWDTYQPQEYY
jgi:DNA-binding Lrp family transcriptional regulator